jgi:hypothetical protein
MEEKKEPLPIPEGGIPVPLLVAEVSIKKVETKGINNE